MDETDIPGAPPVVPHREGGGGVNGPVANGKISLTTKEMEANREHSPGEQDNHEALPYNWDSSPETKPAVGFKGLFMSNWHPTLVYCGVFWSFGMCVAFLGPTLLDLGCQTASDMKRISWVFFFQLCFTLIGSILAGYLAQRESMLSMFFWIMFILIMVFNESNANYVIFVSTALIPLCMFIIPFCKVLGALSVVLCVMGLNMGVIDCLANLKMIHLYGEAVPPFLQAMHFCYGLGAFVSPMIAEPFLLNEDCSLFIDNNTQHRGGGSPLMDTSLLQVNQSLPADTLEDAQEMTRVRYAFWIMCALQAPIPLLVLSLLYREKVFGWKPQHEDKATPQTTSLGGQQKARPTKAAYGTITTHKRDEPFWQQEQYKHYNRYKCCGNSTVQIFTITICTATSMFIFDGLQSGYGGYIYTYAVKSIVDLDKTEGAYLNALYWGTFALGRLMAILLATLCSSAFMLFGNISGCLISTIVMMVFRHDHNALYIGTAFFGLFLSSSTPTALALAEQYIEITSSITTFVVVMAALGDMISPVIVGNLFVVMGPVSFLEFTLIMCIFSVFVYFITIIIGQQTPKHKEKGPSSFFWCRMCCVRAPEEEKDDQSVTKHVKYYTRMSESDSNVELSNMPEAKSARQH